MNSFHLIQGKVDVNALARWAAERGWTGKARRLNYDEGRALHHLVDEAFGPGSLRPFRLLVAPRARVGTLYAYANEGAAALRRIADVAAKPDHARVLPLDRLDSKAMPRGWRAGQRLGFDLRVRPTQRLREPLSTRSGPVAAGAEIDAFLREALRVHAQTPDGMASTGRSREAVYIDWLDKRLGAAADLDRDGTRLVRFRRSRVARGGTSVEGPDAVLHGTVNVKDPEAFARTLRRGLGRHRAYGYGMLLLTAPGRPPPER